MVRLFISIIMLVTLALAILAGCGTSPTEPDGGGITHDYYPNDVGMFWQYEIHDNLTDKIDTVSISITGDTNIIGPGITSQLKRYFWHSTGTVYEKHIYLTENSVQIYSIDDEILYEELFKMPLDNNATWYGPLNSYGSVDSSLAVLYRSISVPAGTFTSPFNIDRTWHQDFEGGYKRTETWLASGVGLVKFSPLVVYSDGARIDTSLNQTWELIAYDLNTFNVEEFPNEPGHVWSYDIFDSIEIKTGTVTVTISGSTEMTALQTQASIWVYQFSDRVDTEYVVTTEDRVSFYSYREAQFPDYFFYFPMALGRMWGIETFAPVSDLIEKGTISVPAGTYTNGFNYTIYGGMFNYYFWYENWIVPDIGVVKSTRYIANLGPYEVQTWELIEHTMPDAPH